ncbi:MAG: methylated-DNA--[protein]-cysteine S-methyltransferase [Planctomycetota bacterium]
MTLRHTTLASPLGPLLVAADDEHVYLVEYAAEERAVQQLARVAKRVGRPCEPGRTDPVNHLAVELAEYFAGDRPEFTVPVRPLGTPFQEQVWQALLRIPAGETRSYAAIAREIGEPTATRAVGTANGANPISILVPCHRVVRTGGALGGYGGGSDRKRWLLDHEQAMAGNTLFAS